MVNGRWCATLDYPAWIGWEYVVEIEGLKFRGVGVLSRFDRLQPVLEVCSLPAPLREGVEISVLAEPRMRLYPA